MAAARPPYVLRKLSVRRNETDPMHGFRCLALLVCLLALGCGLFSRRYAGPSPDGVALMPNPMLIPVTDIDFAWNQIVDTVDDYFEISREQRVREIGGVLVEGSIATRPLQGATILEPLRRDSTPGFERWQSTFQSIQRRADLRVVPAAGGFEVHVAVFKELEDLSRPEFATVGRATRRHDGSLARFEGFETTGPTTLGWIPIGRDVSLEQEILAQLHTRLHEVTGP